MDAGAHLGRESVLGRVDAQVGRAGAERAFVPAAEKYVVEGTIGRGGMGDVLLVMDRDLRRQVALKVMRPGVESPKAALHFVAEAQATSQLEHPGIPPVHDLGISPDGRLYFTMKLVRGRTLREVLHDLFLRRREVTGEYTLHRLVGVLERIAETLHYAHESGVIHRDLKPENVMLGDYGEVHVMDWGVARVRDTGSEEEAASRVATARTDRGLETQAGEVKGTLPYMSPEQVRGDRTLDRRSDVYALGCLLYEVLSLQAPYDPSDSDLLRKVAQAEHSPVETRNPRRRVPEVLARACRKAMAREREERHVTAQALAQDLRSWLDGTSERERRHREADALAAQGIAAVAAYESARAGAAEAEAEAEARALDYKPWQPVAEKRPLVEARQRAAESSTQVALAFAEATNILGAALVQESDNATARAALARLWKGRLEEAELRGEAGDSAHAKTRIARYDDGSLAAYVKGDGTLALSSDPEGAEVRLARYVERDGILVAEEERVLGTTPFGPVPLPMGSYLATLRLAGFRDVRYPVHILRNRAWTGRVRMRTEEEIGAGFVYVPAGPFLYGEGRGTRLLDLPDFAIAKSPVTFGDWGRFLMAVERDHGSDAARQLVPNARGDGDYMTRRADGHWLTLPNNCEGPARERCLKQYGPGFEALLPVAGVTWHDAVAYGEWQTRATGRVCRLPTEEEHEKAARGVDGRKFPWGDMEDASLCKCRDAREEPTQPEPVGAFATAASVYGMLDAAGNSWDWTDSWTDARRLARVSRGGGWSDKDLSLMRCAFRGSGEPSLRFASLGFRLAHGFDARDGA
jgi:eukaryotic-like serine/threonine-protein kinase